MTAVRRFVALDVDGTILNEDGVISAAVSQSISDAAAEGHLVTIATGRSFGSTLPVLRELAIDPEYVVCSNGAVVVRRDPTAPDGYRREFVETFDPSLVLTQVREHLESAHYGIEDAEGRFFVTHDFPVLNVDFERISVTFEELLTIHATRVVVISPGHDLDDFLATVNKIGLNQVSYSVGWNAWMDIAPSGVNKATALQKVVSVLGVHPRDVVVAGDGRNDIEMLQWAAAGSGVSAAMGQAPDEVKAAANRVLPPLHVDGLAELLISL